MTGAVTRESSSPHSLSLFILFEAAAERRALFESRQQQSPSSTCIASDFSTWRTTTTEEEQRPLPLLLLLPLPLLLRRRTMLLDRQRSSMRRLLLLPLPVTPLTSLSLHRPRSPTGWVPRQWRTSRLKRSRLCALVERR